MRVLWAAVVVGAGCLPRVAALDPVRDRPPAAPARDPGAPSPGITRGSGGPSGDWSGRHALGDQEGAFVVYAPTLARDTSGYGVVVLLHADDGTPSDPTRRPELRA